MSGTKPTTSPVGLARILFRYPVTELGSDVEIDDDEETLILIAKKRRIVVPRRDLVYMTRDIETVSITYSVRNTVNLHLQKIPDLGDELARIVRWPDRKIYFAPSVNVKVIEGDQRKHQP